MEGDAWAVADIPKQGPSWTCLGLSLVGHGFPLHLPFLKGFYTILVMKLASFSNKNRCSCVTGIISGLLTRKLQIILQFRQKVRAQIGITLSMKERHIECEKRDRSAMGYPCCRRGGLTSRH